MTSVRFPPKTDTSERRKRCPTAVCLCLDQRMDCLSRFARRCDFSGASHSARARARVASLPSLRLDRPEPILEAILRRTHIVIVGGTQTIEVTLEPAHSGWRLDRALANAVPTLSRERL